MTNLLARISAKVGNALFAWASSAPRTWNPFAELAPGRHVALSGCCGAGLGEVLTTESGRRIGLGHALIHVDGRGDTGVFAKLYGFTERAGRLDDLRVLNTLLLRDGTPGKTHRLPGPSRLPGSLAVSYGHLFTADGTAEIDFTASAPVVAVLLPALTLSPTELSLLVARVLDHIEDAAALRADRNLTPLTVVLHDILTAVDDERVIAFLATMNRHGVSVIIADEPDLVLDRAWLASQPAGAITTVRLKDHTMENHGLLEGQTRRGARIVNLPFEEAPRVKEIRLWRPKQNTDTSAWQPRQPDEWRPWAENILQTVERAVTDGIVAACPDAEGMEPERLVGFFCFMIYPDLPFHDRPFTLEIMEKIQTLPRFAEIDAAFTAKYGERFFAFDTALAELRREISAARAA